MVVLDALGSFNGLHMLALAGFFAYVTRPWWHPEGEEDES